jgi:hypothetical protein
VLGYNQTLSISSFLAVTRGDNPGLRHSGPLSGFAGRVSMRMTVLGSKVAAHGGERGGVGLRWREVGDSVHDSLGPDSTSHLAPPHSASPVVSVMHDRTLRWIRPAAADVPGDPRGRSGKTSRSRCVVHRQAQVHRGGGSYAQRRSKPAICLSMYDASWTGSPARIRSSPAGAAHCPGCRAGRHADRVEPSRRVADPRAIDKLTF